MSLRCIAGSLPFVRQSYGHSLLGGNGVLAPDIQALHRAPAATVHVQRAGSTSSLIANASGRYAAWTPESQSEQGTATNGTAAASQEQAAPKYPIDYVVVDTLEALTTMLELLNAESCVAVDCEGVLLGRANGKLTLMQLAARCGPKRELRIWLVDIQTLGRQAFEPVLLRGVSATAAGPQAKPNSADSRSVALTTSSGASTSTSNSSAGRGAGVSGRGGPGGRGMHMDSSSSSSSKRVSLRWLLQDPACTKLLFDARSDSAALQGEYGIRMSGVHDLQLGEVALRQSRGEAGSWVVSLTRALQAVLPVTPRMEHDLMLGHYTSKKYHAADATEVWEVRPITRELMEYAAADVRYLHAFADALNARLSKDVATQVRLESMRRLSQRVSVSNAEQRSAAPNLLALAHAAAKAAAHTAVHANDNAHESPSRQADGSHGSGSNISAGKGTAASTSGGKVQAGDANAQHVSGPSTPGQTSPSSADANSPSQSAGRQGRAHRQRTDGSSSKSSAVHANSAAVQQPEVPMQPRARPSMLGTSATAAGSTFPNSPPRAPTTGSGLTMGAFGFGTGQVQDVLSWQAAVLMLRSLEAFSGPCDTLTASPGAPTSSALVPSTAVQEGNAVTVLGIDSAGPVTVGSQLAGAAEVSTSVSKAQGAVSSLAVRPASSTPLVSSLPRLQGGVLGIGSSRSSSGPPRVPAVSSSSNGTANGAGLIQRPQRQVGGAAQGAGTSAADDTRPGVVFRISAGVDVEGQAATGSASATSAQQQATESSGMANTMQDSKMTGQGILVCLAAVQAYTACGLRGYVPWECRPAQLFAFFVAVQQVAAGSSGYSSEEPSTMA